MGRWVELEFVLNRHQTQTVRVTLDEDQLEDVSDISDLDPYDWTDEAWENQDRNDWNTYDDEVDNARVVDHCLPEQEDEEDEDESGPRQPEPDRSLLPGRLVIDGDGTVYEVETVTRDGYMTLLDVDTGDLTDDYGGRECWADGVSPGFYRWYRSGDHVIVHDGSNQTVVGASGGLVTLLNGQVYDWSQTYGWTWEEEQAQEETA